MQTAQTQIAEFTGFPKIARLTRECVVTEKIDGTNAVIYISEAGDFLVGSRSRWITPDNDNHGFAKWAYAHQIDLMKLGPGRHFGEWWGSGVQRGYGMKNGEKRWSLFNTIRWALYGAEPQRISAEWSDVVKYQDELPGCVGLVPVLYRGEFDTAKIDLALEELKLNGSRAAPGYMKPEGIVCFHVAANLCLKKTCENDSQPKATAK